MWVLRALQLAMPNRAGLRWVAYLVGGAWVGLATLVIGGGTASGLAVAVTPGETLTGIAAEYGTTVAALAATNGIGDPNLIIAGTVLQIPQPEGSVTVEVGDTLSAIATRYGVTVTSLASANGITDPNEIYPGERLTLPGAAIPSTTGFAGASVVVVPGETLSAIAARYGTSVAALASANGIPDPNEIEVGRTIEIPTAGSRTPTPSPNGTTGLPSALLAHPDRLVYLPDFVQAASTYGVPASLLEAVCFWESGWQPAVISATGAFGMCQIEPWTATYVDEALSVGRSLSVQTPADNIDMGAALLAQLLAATGGDRALAVAAYDQGLTSIAQSGIFPSTSMYVSGVLALTAVFAAV